MASFNRYWMILSIAPLLIGCNNLTASSPSQSESNPANPIVASDTESTFSYDSYAEVLMKYVTDQGLVDYQGLQADRSSLDQFNASFATVTPAIYESWGEAQQIAFLINAYNAFTLQSIIDQTPLKKSIRDIPGVWKGRKFEIAGTTKTLDNIEHQTLRQNFNEPRIHAALVCAAMSCPPLRNEPYRAETLDAQLDDQVQQFLASSHGLRIDREQNRVYVSSIFKWFGEDWEASYAINESFTGNTKERSVLNFISGYLETADQNYLQEGNYSIAYLDYDWSLNKQ